MSTADAHLARNYEELGGHAALFDADKNIDVRIDEGRRCV